MANDDSLDVMIMVGWARETMGSRGDSGSITGLCFVWNSERRPSETGLETSESIVDLCFELVFLF